MRKFRTILLLLLAVSVLLTGCAFRTVDQMYRLPKRSVEYTNLQSVIDGVMSGLEYSAPLSGENQQTVQVADLNGDGTSEFLLFAKGNDEKPLKILVFQKLEDSFKLLHSIESSGYAFDKVEYVQMDGIGGYEMVVGCQLSNQVMRSVKVYRFSGEEYEVLTTASYSRFLTCDLNSDGHSELLVVHPGQTDTDNGIAELYSYDGNEIQRSTEAVMSEPVSQLKRIMPGKLDGNIPAVYVSSVVDANSLITDVFAFTDGRFVNVSLSNELGTSVNTLCNYYIYATDIDGDGITELPSLIAMHALADGEPKPERDMIRWYAMTIDGDEVDKQYTYHNFTGGWYLSLDKNMASRMSVDYHKASSDEEYYDFHIWNEEQVKSSKIFTICALSGKNREETAVENNRFILKKTENTIYAGRLDGASAAYSLDQEYLENSFNMISLDWKTGET